MPYFTRPDFSRQIKQYSGTTAILSGATNILEKFSIKNIEIDTKGASAGDLLLYNGTKFTPAAQGSFANVILNGLQLSYKSGLTYNVSEGSYQINNQPYTYTGGTVNIQSGDSLYSRFDVVFITTAKTPTVLSGTPSLAPVVPLISAATQVQIGIISVPALFTGGTGSTILQVTSNTVFDYYAGGSGIQRAGAYNAQASGEFSFAPSKDSRAYAENSIAMGIGSIASGFSQTVVGKYNDPNTTDIFIVGNGASDGSRANAFRVTTSGSAYVQNKLFVTNIEIETTGASTNQALIYDGTKFKPQLQIITGLTLFTGGTNFISSITSNSLLVKALTGSTGITVTDSNGLVTIGLNFSGTSLGDGVKVLFSSNTTSLSFATLSSQTPSTLNIISSSTGVILFSATTGTNGISGTYVSGLTSAGTGNILLLSSITNNNLIHKSISAGTGMNITESNGTLTFNVTGSTAGSGSTSGTSLGSGVKVLFSSDTNNLAFVTLSSQTPSTLTIISSSTGVILFSASTGSGGTLTGNFLPLSGGTLTGGLSATTISATSIDRLNYIDFNTGASVTQNFGRLFFNGTEQSLSYFGQGITEIKIGQQLYSRVYNNTGAILTKGTAVKVTGATLGLPTICPAIAIHTGDNTVIGLVANDIANNSQGLVINNGLISGITINNFVVGDLLYLSPVSAGTYVNSLTGYGFNIRTNLIGRVVATGSTTGQIYVNTDNEDSTLSLTNLERNIVEGNAISTGVYEFTGITTGSTTTFNISPVRGWIVQNTYANATSPDVTNVYYSGGTNLTTPFLTSNTQTYILLTSASTISYQTTFPTPQQRRENIYLGKLGHGTRTTILNVFNEPDSDISPLSQLRDVLTPIKLINDGVLVSANGANLNINTSAGVLYGMGIGFATNQLNPNSLTINATTPTTFQYRTQTGGTGGPFTSTTTVDVGFYDLNGVRIAVGTPTKQSTNQRIFMLQNGQFRIQYGQQPYTDLATAIAAVDTESFTTFQNFRDNAILIGVLSVRSDATALNNIAQAKFTFASKFGEVLGGTGGISTTTLQQAYDNSTTPEIVTSTNGALTIKNGAGVDNVSNLLEGQNTAGSVTSFIRADGTISGLTFLGDASNLTGVLSKTLLTRNIPVTSQVAQVGSFYLYDKITITSATASVTVTSITSDVSISSYTPSIKFFANTGVTVTFRNSVTLKTEGGLDAVISGSTYDSITFTYNNDIQKYFQTNINNYI